MPEPQLTREELEAKIKQSADELESEVEKEKEESESIIEKADNPEPEESHEEAESSKPEEVETESEEEESEPEEEEKEEDYKERYKESSKEGIELAKDKKKIDAALSEARTLKQPTEDELRQEYADWDLMSDTEKRLAKDNYVFKKRFEIIDKADEEREAINEWNSNVEDFAENPKTLINYPELEGKQKSFKEFAKDKKYRNNSMELIVGAFLHNYEKTKVKHTGKMFETGQGGDKKIVKPSDGKISVEESARLRQSNYPEYMRLLQAGKISSEIE